MAKLILIKRIILQLLSIFFIALVNPIHAQDTTYLASISSVINTGIDDAEQYTNGNMYLNSSDIELVYDLDNGDQIAALKFDNINLPKNTVISNAYIQFTTDEISNSPCYLNIHIEDINDAPSFNNTNYNISNRLLLDTSIAWQPPFWTYLNEQSDAQKTPDISPLIQEIIEKEDWEAGNAMAFIFKGTGQRISVAYELNPSLAARLFIETKNPIPTEPIANLFINELMSSNNHIADEYGDTDDWIELYNGNDFPVNIGGLYMTDDLENLTKWQITTPQIIPANGHAIIWADASPEQGGLHTNFKLNSEGESLALIHKYNNVISIIDEVTFEESPPQTSIGRIEDGDPLFVYFGNISHGFSNDSNGLYQAPPSLSLEGGTYENTIQVEISTELLDASIYYTLNGEEPTANSILYDDPISITNIKLLKAKAFKTGYAPSENVTAFYIVNNPHELPVVSISTHPDNLFDDNQGIYVIGTNGIGGYCSNSPRNFNQDWERPAKISFHEPSGLKAFEVNAGIKIAGGCSRRYNMKSFTVSLRKNTYGDEAINYQLFPDKAIDIFKRIKFRNSGQDFDLMMFRDGINQELHKGMVDLDLQSYRPVVIYLNGQYWGMYGMRDFLNEDHINSHFGVNQDNLDMLTNPYLSGTTEIKHGDTNDFTSLYNFIQNNSLVSSSNYEYVASKVDLNEYMNYNIAQIYLANFDWPMNNVVVWHTKDDEHKWRWMLFDTDPTANFDTWGEAHPAYNSMSHATDPNSTYWPNHNLSTMMLRKILENDSFKDEFVQRTCTFMGILYDPNRVNHLTDSIKKIVEPEIERHIDKWTQFYDNFGGWSQTCGGSRQIWNNNINKYKAFFPSRSNNMRNHINSYFGLDGNFLLTVNCNENSGGNLFFHENEMAIPYDYKNTYFKNIPFKVKAVAKPGFEFSHWLETGETSSEIYFESNQNTTLTPVFYPFQAIINEIHFNPVQGDDFEYIELYNPSSQAINLEGYKLEGDISFTFPQGSTLASEEYALIAKNPNKLGLENCKAYQWDAGTLDNISGLIQIIDNQNNTTDKVYYNAQFKGFNLANGNGPSIILKAPYLHNDNPDNWMASSSINGNPCGENTQEFSVNQAILFEVFPNPTNDNLFINYGSQSAQLIQVEIYNTLGQKVASMKLDSKTTIQINRLQIGDWTAGVYFLKYDVGEDYKIIKVVKQ